MRQVGTLATQQDAERFADYLLTLGVPTRVDPAPSGFSVWAIEENDVERARKSLSEFQANPADPRYAAAHATAEHLRQRQAADRRKAQRNVVDLSQRWAGPLRRRIPLTMLLVGLSVTATLLSDFDHRHEVSRWLLLSDSGMNLTELWHGQLWRLWTPMLLHANWLHLIFNMYWLYVLGSAIEIRMGTRVLAGLVLATQLAATVGQLLVSQPDFVGISGAVYGLFGYVWMKTRYDPGAGLFLDSSIIFLMVAWLFVGPYLTSDPVANAAHFAGLGAGIVLGYPMRRLLR
ncbi:MAG TPA: rhomboid family intramembrane serine protease [Pirellulales bacterium]|jgi:GlpG protein|nr:rhomboid family intramembrane serine protease [Pirellulales bacterium]